MQLKANNMYGMTSLPSNEDPQNKSHAAFEPKQW